MITPSGPAVLAQEWEEFRERVRAVDPEVLDDLLHALRWLAASRNPKIMRALTEASRAFGALRLEAVIRR
jgi:hypothetical protein